MNAFRDYYNKIHNKFTSEEVKEKISEKVAAYMAKNKDIRQGIFNKRRESGFVDNVADNVAEAVIHKRKRSQSINKPSPNLRPKKYPKEPEISFLSMTGVNQFFDDFKRTSKTDLYNKVT